MVPLRGIEPPTHALRMRCSTPELQRPASGASQAIVALPENDSGDNKGNGRFWQVSVFPCFFR